MVMMEEEEKRKSNGNRKAAIKSGAGSSDDISVREKARPGGGGVRSNWGSATAESQGGKGDSRNYTSRGTNECIHLSVGEASLARLLCATRCDAMRLERKPTEMVWRG
ncbi:hypothetical protein BR93DRAFT_161520 [Coniochaeta sp. PMI_546]|nr:hypothetical protein BR93DRAFT_161520 [Coniochaeta sp. PMI_546]